jgi:hypothetical protein
VGIPPGALRETREYADRSPVVLDGQSGISSARGVVERRHGSEPRRLANAWRAKLRRYYREAVGVAGAVGHESRAGAGSSRAGAGAQTYVSASAQAVSRGGLVSQRIFSCFLRKLRRFLSSGHALTLKLLADPADHYL